MDGQIQPRALFVKDGWPFPAPHGNYVEAIGSAEINAARKRPELREVSGDESHEHVFRVAKESVHAAN